MGQQTTNKSNQSRKLIIFEPLPKTNSLYLRHHPTQVATTLTDWALVLVPLPQFRYTTLMSDESRPNSESGEPHETPIDGTLDLHTFSPKDVKSLVPEYLDLCRERGILQVRIIHGKGTGTLKRIVQAALDRHPAVGSYHHEGGSGGSWGATVVILTTP
jgi:hypothetical protein